MSHLESREKVNYFLRYSIFESLQRFGGLVPHSSINYQVLWTLVLGDVVYQFSSPYFVFLSTWSSWSLWALGVKSFKAQRGLILA